MPVLELSIGDYVLAGGEVAALVMIEAIARLIPGVLGNPESARRRLVLRRPGRPAGGARATPGRRSTGDCRCRAVLTSGDHGAVAAYRRAESLRRTEANRPDLLGAARRQPDPTLVS